MSSSVDERITDEIEALQAILLGDLTIHSDDGKPRMIEIVVHPSTGDDTKRQYVCITLEVTLTPEYPDTTPAVKLRNPRGLDDSVIESITRQIQNKLHECAGQAVVFELVEVLRENLTNSNLPSGQCVICLYDFSAGDAFTKTPCYHYFHSHCLANHLQAGEKYHKEEYDKLPLWQQRVADAYTATCPVCRESIACDASALSTAPPPLALRTARAFELTAELRELQARMAALYQRQRTRGGIIDKDKDNTKLLLRTSLGTGNPMDSSPDLSPNEGEVLNELNCEPAGAEATGAAAASSSPRGPGAYRGPYRGFNRNRALHRRGSKSRPAHGSPSCASATR